MTLNRSNTQIISLVNLINLMVNVIIRLLNIKGIHINVFVEQSLTYLVKICFFSTLFYLFIILKSLNQRKAFAPFILYCLLQVTMSVIFDIFPPTTNHLYIYGITEVLFLIICGYALIISLKIKPRNLSRGYSAYFAIHILSLLFTVLLPVVATAIFESYNPILFAYAGFLNLLPLVIIVFILKAASTVNIERNEVGESYL